MPKPGSKLSLQNIPTTTGESIMGTSMSVVTNPLPRKRSRTNMASPKPTTVSRATVIRA